MTDYIFSETKEESGAIVHIVTWTLDKTIGKAKLCQKVYDNYSSGPSAAIRDAAERLGVSVGSITYGLNGYANARILEG